MKNYKALFINPNPRGMSLVQPVVSLFYSIFKDSGIEMKFFDTTFYDVSSHYTNTDKFKQKIMGVKKYDDKSADLGLDQKPFDQLFPDFRAQVKEFKPDVILASAMESTFNFTIEMLNSIRDLQIPHVLGGVFATFSPEFCLKYEAVDIVYIGEAEKNIVELVKKIAERKSISEILGVCFESNGEIVKNQLNTLSSLDETPRFEADIFHPTRFTRAMAGKMYRMFPVETHRGCPGKCAFCNSPLQTKMYQEQTQDKYFRKKSIKNVMVDIDYFVKEMQAEYFFFWADNFLAYSQREIDEFCEAYSEYNIPFYIQSYPTTLDENKIKKLIQVGLNRLGMGVEHGNEDFRKRVVNRTYSNEKAIKKVEILQKYDVQYSCNNIVGFPMETPELHEDTVLLNRALKPHTASCSIFTPFRGTPLRELCIKKGYIQDNDVIAPTNSEESILKMPQFTADQILGKSRTFNLYLKFPKKRWPDIKRAELITAEGDKIWEELKKEYSELY